MKTLSLFILTSFFYILGISTYQLPIGKFTLPNISRTKLVLSPILLMMVWQNIPQWLRRNWKSVALEEPSGFAVLYGTRGIIKLPRMTWDELKQMAKNGHESPIIAGHIRMRSV